MSRRFVVIYEAPADFATAKELADRVLVDEIDWLEEGLLDSQRQWLGEDQPGGLLTWSSISRRARAMGISVRGHFAEGEPGLADAQAARRAIAYVLRKFDTLDAIVLIRDVDDQEQRRDGLKQARANDKSSRPIIIGAAIVERECWVICGFEPANDEQRAKLAEESQKLGFNPCLRSHELTAGKDNQAKKSAKRVLAVLTNDDWEQQRECWRATPLATLQERGKANGLSEYLTEIKLRLVPLITGREVSQELL